jgi:hypothetical protein
LNFLAAQGKKQFLEGLRISGKVHPVQEKASFGAVQPLQVL